MDKPDVDFIEGLFRRCPSTRSRPTATHDQTVGTITEVYDYLRLLHARAGTPHCPTCGMSRAPNPATNVDQVLAMPGAPRFALAPVVQNSKGEFADLFDKLNAQGYSRVRVDGVVHPRPIRRS